MASIKTRTYISGIKMPFVKGIFFASIIAFPVCCKGQFIEEINDAFKAKPTFQFRIDTRNSFISARIARILGLKVGLLYNNKVEVGLGYNRLWSMIDQHRKITSTGGGTITVNSTYRLWYLSPYMEYAFYDENKWRFSILAMVGAGPSWFQYSDENRKKQETAKKMVYLWEPYMTAEYAVIDWVTAGFGVGYRLNYSGNTFSRKNLNSPIYVLKLSVDYPRLLKHFKQRR